MANDRMNELQEKLKQKTKQENKNVNNNENVSKSKDEIVLEKKNNKPELERQTYYLEQKHIDMIDELKNKSGYAKYELVQLAIEILYDRAKIK